MGCSTKGRVNTIPGATLATAPLERHEYEVLGDATGEGCAEEVCYFTILCTRKSGESGGARSGRIFSTAARVERTTAGFPFNLFSGQKYDPTSVAEEVATYQAIESVTTADAVLLPRKTATSEREWFLSFFSRSRSCARVTGKAIRIKVDHELTGGPIPKPQGRRDAAPPPPPPPPPPPFN